jgi:hypothetical protein
MKTTAKNEEKDVSLAILRLNICPSGFYDIL